MVARRAPRPSNEAVSYMEVRPADVSTRSDSLGDRADLAHHGYSGAHLYRLFAFPSSLWTPEGMAHQRYKHEEGRHPRELAGLCSIDVAELVNDRLTVHGFASPASTRLPSGRGCALEVPGRHHEQSQRLPRLGVDSPRTTRSRCIPANVGTQRWPAVGRVSPRLPTSAVNRSRGSTLPVTAPLRSWGVTTSVPARASAVVRVRVTWPPSTRPKPQDAPRRARSNPRRGGP